MRIVAKSLLLALSLAGLAAAQGSGATPAVSVDVAPREATVGDRLEATVILDLPEGWQATRPLMEGELGAFTVISGSWVEHQSEHGGSRWTWSGQLSAFETGSLELPALAFELSHGDEHSTLQSRPFEVNILSTIEQDEAAQSDIADLKSPLSIPPDYGTIIRASALLALLLAASALAWWLHRRYAEKLAAAAIPEDPFHRLPPHIWVYKALQELLDKRLEEQGRIDLFYSELSTILKRYSGGRYRLDLLEKTTAESPPLLRQAGAPERAIQKISALLMHCDEVKFANSRPGPQASRAAVEAVYEVVDATKPVEPDAGEPRRGAA